MSQPATVRIESRRVGTLEVPVGDLIHFPGLPGFPDARRFVILEHDRESAFAWLVCADRGDLAFAVVSPFEFFPDYAPHVAASVLESLEGKDGDEVEVLTIATIDGSGEIHVNLAAPLVLHPGTRRGLQVILDRGDYSARQALPALEAPDAQSASADTATRP